MATPPTTHEPETPDADLTPPADSGRSLWRDRDFRRFWIGRGIASIGDEISALALPLIAVLVLDATATQMGVINALGYLPFLLVGLQAGVWVDRMRRRRILIWSDLLQAALLLSLPVAGFLGVLRIEQLYALALMIGAINVVASVAQQSFLPSLVDRRQLPTANSRLEATYSATGIVGPGAAGALVQVLSAPIAIVSEVGVSPALLGLIVASGGPGALLGALAAVPVARRLGVGPTIVGAQVLTGIACLAAPLAGGPIWIAAIVLAGGEFLLGLARTLFNITQLSLRQAITPDRLQGRVNATMRFMMWGVTPVGALAGGLLGSAIGLRQTLLLAAVGVLAAFAWVALSEVAHLRDQPAPAEA